MLRFAATLVFAAALVSGQSYGAAVPGYGGAFPGNGEYGGPDRDGTPCARRWETCGGLTHAGPTCCAGANACVRHDQYFSTCEPAPLPPGVVREYGRCSPTAGPNAPEPTAGRSAPEPTAGLKANRTASPGACEPLTECTLTPGPSAVSVCLDPTHGPRRAERYAQCGGERWSGATRCRGHNVCERRTRWYSMCTPTRGMPAPRCGTRFQQCGGRAFRGQTCCDGDMKCRKVSVWHSHCV